MRVGTQSILWGVHQFILHPILVYKAWTRIYARRPSLRETLCIFAHDLGYIGKTTMDGPDGLLHPEFGARLVRWLLGFDSEPFQNLVRYHSRAYAKLFSTKPSVLCLPDKLAVLLYPNWLYIALGRASGEIAEYKAAMSASNVPDHIWIHDLKSITLTWTIDYTKSTPILQDRLYEEFLLPQSRPHRESAWSTGARLGTFLSGLKTRTSRALLIPFSITPQRFNIDNGTPSR